MACSPNEVIILVIRKKLCKKKGRNGMLENTRKKEIEDIVDNIIDSNELRTPGFDLAEFLCKKQDFKIGQQDMVDGTTGLLFINEKEFIPGTKTHKLIVVSNSLKHESNFKMRRRYIVAHEYAHSVLHKKDSVQYAHRDAAKKDNQEELEADFFARCLLMPSDLVNSILSGDIAKKMDADEKTLLISRVFNVTPKKAKIRLEEDLQTI